MEKQTPPQKAKLRDRLPAVDDAWTIKQHGIEILKGDGLSIRMIFRNMCRLNFIGEEYEEYIVFPLSNGFEVGEIELACEHEVIMKGTIVQNFNLKK